MASGQSTYPSSAERTNYARLCRAIVDLCTDVLREVLSTQVVPSQLKNKVRNCADLSKKPLNAEERHKIHGASSSSSYRDFDITFLYRLINSFSTQELRDDLSSFIQPSQIWTEVQRCPLLLSTLNKEQEAVVKNASATGNYSICDCWLLSQLLKNLCPSYSLKLLPSTNKRGGNSLPLPTNIEFGDDVERIRYLRNKVYGHVSDTCVTDVEFRTQWSELNGILSRMDQRLKTGGRYTTDLKDIETDCMDDKLKEEYISEIKKLADADKDLRSEIGKQGEEILYLRTKVSQEEEQFNQLVTSNKHLRGKLKRTNKRIETVDTKISTIKESTEQLHNSVKLLTGDLKNIEVKEKEEVCVPRHIREQNRIIAETWRAEEVVFVETRGTKRVLEAIRNHSVVTVIGNAGAGKSATIHHAALALHLNGYQILKVDNPAEIMQYLDPTSKQIFVIDDPVGIHGLDQDAFKLWQIYHSRLDKCISAGSTKLLCSIRKQVAKESSFTKHEACILNKMIIDIQDERNALNEGEKLCILQQHLKVTKCSLQITNEARVIFKNTQELFPLICKLFSSREEFQKIGWEFFKNPFELILADLDEMQSHDKLKYCVLVICFAFENFLNPNMFNPFDKKENLIKAKPFMEACGVTKSAFLSGMKETSHLLSSVYLRQEGETYRFSHDLIYDVVAFHFGQHYPKQVIELCSSSFIRQRIAVSKDTIDNDSYVVILEPKYFRILLDRLIADLDKGIYNHTLVNKCWSDKIFLDVFSQEFEKRKDHFINLFSRKIKGKPIYSDEVYRELKQHVGPQTFSLYFMAMKLLNIRNITGLHWVITFAHKALYSLLWRNLSSPCRQRICNDVPLLHLACLGGDIEICRVLLKEEYIKINSPFMGDSALDFLPLDLAAMKSFEVVKLLLDNGARVDGMQNAAVAGRTPLSYASAFGNVDVISELINHGADISKGSPLVYGTLPRNAFEIIKLLLDHKASIDMQAIESRTALMLASRYSTFEAIQLLLDHKASVDMQDKEKWTPLMMASMYNSYEVVRLLLNHKASVDMQNDTGKTALMIASQHNSVDVVQLLLDHKANFDIQDIIGWTPLMIASRFNSVEVVKLLIDHKASVDVQNDDGWTALTVASQYNSCKVVELLLDHTTNVDIQNNEGCAALLLASLYNNSDAVQLLLDHKATIDMQNYNGLTALMGASRCNSFDVVKLLLEHKASVDMQTHEGWTALLLALEYNSFDAVQLLLDHKAKVDVQNNDGFTALMLASANNSFDVVQTLLDHKANVNMQNKEEVTALILASRYGPNQKCNFRTRKRRCASSVSTSVLVNSRLNQSERWKADVSQNSFAFLIWSIRLML